MARRSLKGTRSGRRVSASRVEVTGHLGAGYFAAENKDTETIRRGQWVAIHASGSGVVRANASDDSRNAVGMMSEDTAVGATQNVVTDEVFTLSDWSNVIGSTSLRGGVRYYLDVVSGRMTTTAPSTLGQVAQYLGRALDTLRFEIEVGEAVLL